MLIAREPALQSNGGRGEVPGGAVDGEVGGGVGAWAWKGAVGELQGGLRGAGGGVGDVDGLGEVRVSVLFFFWF